MKLKFQAALAILRAALIALVAAAGISGFAIGPALALQVDQNLLFNARQTPDQQLSYYRITINWNDQNIGSAQQFGALPANAYIFAIDAYVNTAFNAGTTNVITIGTTKANANEIVASGITAGTIGHYALTSAAGLGTAVSMGGTWLNTNMPLYAKYAQTGTAATAGSVVIVIAYAANNDM